MSQQKPQMRKILQSFRDAGQGLMACIRSERNFRVHLTVGGYVIFFGVLAEAEAGQWLALILSIALVIFAEMVNTALEMLCDAQSSGYSADIGLIKDITAGAVLVTALAAALVGIVIFVRLEVLERIFWAVRDRPALLVAFVLSLPLAVLFIRGRKGR